LILPLAPKGMSADELAARYETFIRYLVLDGVRKSLKSEGSTGSASGSARSVSASEAEQQELGADWCRR
jgi:hypothetical protein